MKAIMIEGMEMPANCSDCPFEIGLLNVSICFASEYVLDTTQCETVRHEDCPLKETEELE